jgi:PhnB protein
LAALRSLGVGVVVDAFATAYSRDDFRPPAASIPVQCIAIQLSPKGTSMTVQLDAYLFFPGNAEEAISFYQQVFGGQLTITRRGDVDPSATGHDKNQVVNATLTGGELTLRASDRGDTSLDEQTRVELSLIGTDESKLRGLFDALSQGGTVRAKLERQFWGDIFGAVTDRYGIGWQVNIGSAGA